MMTSNTMTKRHCANGVKCVQYVLIGDATRLSTSNKNDICFACEERGVRVTPDRSRRSRTRSAQKER